MALGCLAGIGGLQAQSDDALINKLVEKGILTDKEAKDLVAETAKTPTNLVSASKWKINDAIKSLNLFGDVRLRYEYRSAENVAGSGVTSDAYQKERFRYAVRLGIKGDLFDNFYYGLRVETSTNPRSPWNTFGNDTTTGSTTTPSAKNDDGINIGQAYVGWVPTSWYEMTLGRMPMPLYTTPMLWDSDINPEGAVEKFKLPLGNYVDMFANFGQFVYQDTALDTATPSSDTFLLAWQVGANVKLTKDISFKAAPVLYTYTGEGSVGSSLNGVYTGEGQNGLNPTPTGTGAYNQAGISNLMVLEIPAELDFKVGNYAARVFGDFAYNLQGDDRARAAASFQSTPGVSLLPHAYTDDVKAYQVGFGFGNYGPVYGPTSGLVYGTTSKKHTWEARAYWQHVEQYAADPNLLDSDFFEGRANLQGVYSALAYSFTDNLVATVRYGYAQRINDNLGTGGNNSDLPGLNPIRNFHLIQLDLTLRF
jgi:hypothetical protein